jgi:hypothetical protein
VFSLHKKVFHVSLAMMFTSEMRKPNARQIGRLDDQVETATWSIRSGWHETHTRRLMEAQREEIKQSRLEEMRMWLALSFCSRCFPRVIFASTRFRDDKRAVKDIGRCEACPILSIGYYSVSCIPTNSRSCILSEYAMNLDTLAL